MAVLNRLATGGCDLLLLPFRSLSPFWGLLWLSLLTTLLVLAGYKLISSPSRIKAAKESIKADILSIRLYKDFWRVVAGSFLRSLFHTGRYFLLNLLPLLIMLPVLVPLFVQMDIRFGMRPFRPGETVVVKAAFSGEIDGLDIQLNHGPNLKPSMNPLYIPALSEVDWRLQVIGAGEEPLTVSLAGKSAGKTLLTGDRFAPLSNCRLRSEGGSFMDRLSYPAEPGLTEPARMQSISLHYPSRDIDCLGLKANWLVWYILMVLVLALALKKRFGVEF